MVVSSTLWRKLKTLAVILWLGFLCSGPVTLFVMGRFRWWILAKEYALGAYLVYPAAVGGICAIMTAVVYLFRSPLKMILPIIIFTLDYSLLFSPLQNVIEVKGFADFIKPESSYIQKHCAPVSFVQDGKTYRFGICDLVIAHDGSDDFGFVYETSGDVENYMHLSPVDRALFVKLVRKYYNDDPNAGFEYVDFTAQRFYHDFYDISFDPNQYVQAETGGFTATYGPPPKNPKSPYEPFF